MKVLTILFVFVFGILADPECKLKYTYILWIGDNIDQEYKLHMKSDCGIHFYDAMNEAAAIDSHYVFDATYYTGLGYFITEINGVSNNPTTNSYWMIYNLTSNPNAQHKPQDTQLSPLGVSSLEVVDHTYYLFWYKTLVYP